MLTTYELFAICAIAPLSLALFTVFCIETYYADRIEDNEY